MPIWAAISRSVTLIRPLSCGFHAAARSPAALPYDVRFDYPLR